MPTQRDTSPIVPGKFLFRFPGRRCKGAVSDTVPDYYIKTLTPTDVGSNAVGYLGTKTYHEFCLALYDPTVGPPPTNQAALDALALRFAKDQLSWWGVSFDRVYNSVVAADPNGFMDEIRVNYDYDGAKTRIFQKPFLNDEPEELMHHDPANADCNDGNNGGNVVSQAPCGLFYGPPLVCAGGHVQIAVYRVCIIDGRLTQTFIRNDTA